jgi:hypothetical protein
VQGKVRWRDRHSTVAPPEVSRGHRYQLRRGRTVPLKRPRLAIDNNGGGRGRATGRAVTNCINGELGNGGKVWR